MCCKSLSSGEGHRVHETVVSSAVEHVFNVTAMHAKATASSHLATANRASHGPKVVNRTPSHIACTDAHIVAAHHIALIPCTTSVAQGSRIVCPKHFLVPSLVPRHVSRPALYTQHLSSLSLASTSPSFTGSGSRLITSRIHCADSRGLRGDGFTDPEPCTGYDPKEDCRQTDRH